MSARLPRHPHRHRRVPRPVPSAAAALVVVGAVAWLVVTMVGASSPHAVATTTTSAPPPPTTSTTTTVPVTTTTTTTVPVTTTTTPEGALPQTDAEPSSASPQFQAAMAELFDAVAHGTPPSAGPAFFPEAAYDQLKTIRYPASDWQYRLLAEYDEDLAAATTSLGPDPGSATLVSVQVPMEYAHWVPVGVCDNSVGYFEVANSRVVYSTGGVIRSFGIASLISWRGEWYVVHLGAILRSGHGGEVLDPQAGPGTSAPSTTC